MLSLSEHKHKNGSHRKHVLFFYDQLSCTRRGRTTSNLGNWGFAPSINA